MKRGKKQQPYAFIKKEWGTEKSDSSLSNLHKKPSSRSIAFSRFAVVLTIIFWMVYFISVIFRQLIDGPKTYQFTLEVVGYLSVVTFLIFSALIYLITRQGALQRFREHRRISRFALDRYFANHQPSISVLIPSYSEETRVIRKTILSAALQEYPNTRVVLLLDDDPMNASPSDKARLKATYGLKKEIEGIFSEPHGKFTKVFSQIENKYSNQEECSKSDIVTVASQYKWAARWLKNWADKEMVEDHVDKFFVEQVLLGLSDELNVFGDALVGSYKEGEIFSSERLLQMYRRLVSIFNVEIEIFERKRYASLSHEPNKAMNLNSYIGLMGGMYKKEETPGGTILTPTKNSEDADMIVRDSEFVLTLDADSILLREYCLRLVYFLQEPANSKVAVVQTPYSSFRGAPSRLERLAGATTDIQHIIHQGMTYYNATFWVGANAVIRKAALEDIKEEEYVGGIKMKRYIQDYTVIEDTESSIDIALKDWKLVNYPERLSYSATPPDFGSLVIQRRRWANGGLLILPKLVALVRKRKEEGRPITKTEFIIRLNYMASIAWSNIGLVFLLAYPYDGRLLSPFVLLAAMPYFIAMAMDLKYCRYNYSDIFRIYGFNLILLPVNIAGTFKSLQQALSTKKTPFGRTPKVKNRTSAAIIYVVSPLLIVAFSIFILNSNIEARNWGNAAFAGFNAFAASWAIFAYIGIKNLFVDVWFGTKDLLYVKYQNKNAQKNAKRELKRDWRNVLYHGGTSVPNKDF